MFTTLMKSVVGSAKLKGLIVAGAVLAGLPAVASADRHRFHVDVDLPAPVIVHERHDDDCGRVWVPAVYRTVTERVWVPDVTTTQVQRVEIPAEYGYRDVIVSDVFGHRHCRREQVLICPARCEERQVIVVVCPAHYEVQSHQELVCDGHYETRGYENREVESAPPRLEIRLPF